MSPDSVNFGPCCPSMYSLFFIKIQTDELIVKCFKWAILEYDIVNYLSLLTVHVHGTSWTSVVGRKVGNPSILRLSVDDTRIIRMLVGYFSWIVRCLFYLWCPVAWCGVSQLPPPPPFVLADWEISMWLDSSHSVNYKTYVWRFGGKPPL